METLFLGKMCELFFQRSISKIIWEEEKKSHFRKTLGKNIWRKHFTNLLRRILLGDERSCGGLINMPAGSSGDGWKWIIINNLLNPSSKKMFLLYMKYTTSTDTFTTQAPLHLSLREYFKRRDRKSLRARRPGCRQKDCFLYTKGAVTMKS